MVVQQGSADQALEAIVPFGAGRAGRIAAIVGLGAAHLLATGSTLVRGPNATAALGYVVFVVLSGVLLGRRALWIAAGLVAAANGVVAALLFGSHWPPPVALPAAHWSHLDGWAHTAEAFAILTAVLCAPVVLLIRRFERGLAEGERTLVLLEEEREGQVRAAEARRRSEAAVAQAQRSQVVGRVGAALAHQFNNALVVIRGEAEVLRDGNAGAEDQAAATAAILAASRRATLLTKKLLSLARPASARAAVSDVGQCLAELARIAAQFLPADVYLSPRAAPGLLARIGEGQLEQVLINLVLNARDAMPGGGRIEVIAERDGASGPRADWLRLSVRDSGGGMTSEVQAHLFEPFFTTKREGLGAGLGLVSTRQIVEGAGGRIEVETAAGEGTTVTVLIPAVTAATQGVPSGVQRVLLLDPDERSRLLAAAALRQSGLVVIDAPNAAAALEQVRRQRGDLDLLCVSGSPGIGGVAALIEEFRALHSGAPILLLEAAPLSPAELVARAVGLLRRRQAPAEER